MQSWRKLDTIKTEKILHKLNNDGSKKLDLKGNPILNDDLIDLHLRLKEAEEFNYLKEQKLFKIKKSN